VRVTVDERRAELARSLAAVRARIASACVAARRSPDDVTLIAVTKTFPASDVGLLAELGVTDVAENRDQEAKAKHAAVVSAHPGLRWNFVGQLQRNKVRSVTRYADAVHSVDRIRLATALGTAAADRPVPLDVLLQVDLEVDSEADPEVDTPGRTIGLLGPRGGARTDELPALAAAVIAQPGLRLRGLMAVAPLTGSADTAFAGLAVLAAELRAEHPGADWLSAGMSGDLEAAVAHGATHVRVGRALLGNRVALGGTVTSEADE
jgi:uncharacterized pyridoxal phosphate-containing UPF0001 family protein